jgi:hypothetical protein
VFLANKDARHGTQITGALAIVAALITAALAVVLLPANHPLSSKHGDTGDSGDTRAS